MRHYIGYGDVLWGSLAIATVGVCLAGCMPGAAEPAGGVIADRVWYSQTDGYIDSTCWVSLWGQFDPNATYVVTGPPGETVYFNGKPMNIGHQNLGFCLDLDPGTYRLTVDNATGGYTVGTVDLTIPWYFPQALDSTPSHTVTAG